MGYLTVPQLSRHCRQVLPQGGFSCAPLRLTSSAAHLEEQMGRVCFWSDGNECVVNGSIKANGAGVWWVRREVSPLMRTAWIDLGESKPHMLCSSRAWAVQTGVWQTRQKGTWRAFPYKSGMAPADIDERPGLVTFCRAYQICSLRDFSLEWNPAAGGAAVSVINRTSLSSGIG